jgi:hypothetical protein
MDGMVHSDALDAELPLHKKRSSPIGSGGGDPYRGTDPMQIWGPHKNS